MATECFSAFSFVPDVVHADHSLFGERVQFNIPDQYVPAPRTFERLVSPSFAYENTYKPLMYGDVDSMTIKPSYEIQPQRFIRRGELTFDARFNNFTATQSFLPEELETISFDIAQLIPDISFEEVLSRAATPPIESLPSTPETSPLQSRSTSPYSGMSTETEDETYESSFNFDFEENDVFGEVLCVSPSTPEAEPMRNTVFVDTILPKRKITSRSKSSSTSKSEPIAKRAKRTPKTKAVRDAGVAKAKAKSKRARQAEVICKRDSHNVSERERRKDLKKSFTALRLSVPKVMGNARVHTGLILKYAIEYIRALEQEEKNLLAAKATLSNDLLQRRNNRF